MGLIVLMGIELFLLLCLCCCVEFDECMSFGWCVLWCGVVLLVVGVILVVQYLVVWVVECIVVVMGYCVLLVDSQGSIWYGSVMLVLMVGNGGVDVIVLFGWLFWLIDMLFLLIGMLCVYLMYDCVLEKLVMLMVMLGYWDVEVGMVVLLVLLLEGIGVLFNMFKLDGWLWAQWMLFLG